VETSITPFLDIHQGISRLRPFFFPLMKSLCGIQGGIYEQWFPGLKGEYLLLPPWSSHSGKLGTKPGRLVLVVDQRSNFLILRKVPRFQRPSSYKQGTTSLFGLQPTLPSVKKPLYQLGLSKAICLPTLKGSCICGKLGLLPEWCNCADDSAEWLSVPTTSDVESCKWSLSKINP
jgi:hypothetical protein